jgi:uncharacterized protein (TIGR02246 family)
MTTIESRDNDQIATGVLTAWADGIRLHEPQRVASLFTDDAIFQGFDPQHTVGRAGVTAYYAKQPAGLTANFTIVERRRPSADTRVAFALVDFTLPDGRVIPVHLTVVLRSTAEGWLISHYHVSKIEPPTGTGTPVDSDHN